MKSLPPGENRVLPPEWHEEETPLSEIVMRALEAIRKRFWFPIIFILLGVGLAAGALKLIEPKYSSSVSIRIERKSPLRDPNEINFTKFSDKGYLQGEVMWFTYRPVIEEMLSRVGLVEAVQSDQEKLQLIQNFQEHRILVQPFRGANVLQVTSSWSSPGKAQEIVATLADVFIERYEQYNQDEMERQTSFLSRQVQDLKARIEEKEASLSEFQKTARLLNTQEGLKSLDESLTTLEIELGKAEFDLKTLLYNKKNVQTQLDSIGQGAPINSVLLSHLSTPTSPLYDKLSEAETLEKSINLLENKDDTLISEGEYGQPSPVNEALRLSLIQRSPLRSMMDEVIRLEKELRTLQLRYMPKHDSVLLAKDKLDDASSSARSMIAALDSAGVKLYDKLGPSILLAQAATWAPGESADQQKLPKMKEKLAGLKTEIKSMIRQFDPNAVDIFDEFGASYLLSQATTWQGMGVSASEQIESLNEQLSQMEFNEETINTRIASLKDEIRKTERRYDDLPASQAIMEGKVRELKVLEDLYVMLQQKFSTAMIEARSNMWQVEIVDPPVKATEPDFPKPVLFLAAGLMFGLAFGCGLPILIDLVADRIGSPEEIEKKLGVPVLAKLPELGVKSLPQEGWLDRLKALGFKKGDS